MARILTGIQSSGKVHLGNIIGAIRPALSLASIEKESAYFFIADMHSFTSVHDADALSENVLQVAASWLACGMDVEKDVFYRQSDVPEVSELTWYLTCFAPFQMLKNAHSFKDKLYNLANVNAGVFTYPVLMAADILMYDANIVPVGKDQKQHLGITRDIAEAFNRKMGDTLVIPDAYIREEVMTVPGTDGRKMSKSYKNYIDIFVPDAQLEKVVKTIVTDSTPVKEPKDPDTCNVARLYELIANEDKIQELRSNYFKGGFGYGEAKQFLFKEIQDKFKVERENYNELMKDKSYIIQQLRIGAERARITSSLVLQRIRKTIFKSLS